MGIIDLHFHDSTFTAVKRSGDADGGLPARADADAEDGAGESGPCLGCLVVAALVVAGVATALAFLAKRRLGGAGTEETTLSEFDGEDVA